MSNNPIKKQTQKYNPTEEKRRTARINSLVKENEELREKLAKTEYELDTKRMLAHSLEWSIKIIDEKLQEKRDETEQLKLKLIQANIRIDKAKSYLCGNFPINEDNTEIRGECQETGDRSTEELKTRIEETASTHEAHTP